MLILYKCDVNCFKLTSVTSLMHGMFVFDSWRNATRSWKKQEICIGSCETWTTSKRGWPRRRQTWRRKTSPAAWLMLNVCLTSTRPSARRLTTTPKTTQRWWTTARVSLRYVDLELFINSEVVQHIFVFPSSLLQVLLFKKDDYH